MKPRAQAVKDLEANGYVFKRKGGRNHDIYYNESLGSIIPVKRHDFNENDLNYIRKEIKANQRGRS